MVGSEQIELANFIKDVHEDLRKKSKLVGADTAWKQHCEDTEKLQQYAATMKALATSWEDACNSNKYFSRIEWVYEASKDYFNNISKIRLKEITIINKNNTFIENKVNQNNQYHQNLTRYTIAEKWKLLDVGSCYNPFQHIESFEVTAIDIAPAVETVFKCDFTQVTIGQKLLTSNTEISVLPQENFDIIVFSLFLEYLPCPVQRKLCCIKAYKLLKNEGILIIISPDSNHSGSNVKYIKSWKFVLAKIGFVRVKYEKLKHIHCMIFRKAPLKEIPVTWVDSHKAEQVFDEIYIPQDFKKSCEEFKSIKKFEKLTSEDVIILNEQLPFSDAFDEIL